MEYNESLVNGGVTKSLVRFAAPVMFANVLQLIYSATDLYILGNFATKADVSGATIGGQIIALITISLSGITLGLIVSLGRYSGTKSEKDLSAVVGSAIVLFAGIAAVLTVTLVCLNTLIVNAMSTPAEAVGAARSYLLICSLGSVFIVGYNVVGCIFRGLGSSRLALYFVAISCVINVALDLVFIRGLGLGATGAGLATVIAQGTSLALAIAYIKLRGLGFSLSRSYIRFRWPYVRQILKTGAPITCQEILVSFSFIIITKVINKMGVDESAAAGIVEKLLSGIFILPTMTMSAAVAAMSSHNIGAGKPLRAQKCMWMGMLISVLIAIPICALGVFRGDIPVSLFGSDPGVLRNGTLYLNSYVFETVGLAVVFIFNHYFTSSGHSLFAMTQSIIATFLIRIPLVLLISRADGVTLLGIGAAAPITTAASAVACVIFYFYLSRRQKLHPA